MKITLCGSTKFADEFRDANLRLSKAGHVVYSVAGFGHSGDNLTSEEKQNLDMVHLRKIDNSDAIWIVHSEYIGESTQREILYAANHDKLIMFQYPRILIRSKSQNPNAEPLFDSDTYKKAKRVCSYNGCTDWTKACPCPLCYE
jgi:hypothetical protein